MLYCSAKTDNHIVHIFVVLALRYSVHPTCCHILLIQKKKKEDKTYL